MNVKQEHKVDADHHHRLPNRRCGILFHQVHVFSDDDDDDNDMVIIYGGEFVTDKKYSVDQVSTYFVLDLHGFSFDDDFEKLKREQQQDIGGGDDYNNNSIFVLPTTRFCSENEMDSLDWYYNKFKTRETTTTTTPNHRVNGDILPLDKNTFFYFGGIERENQKMKFCTDFWVMRRRRGRDDDDDDENKNVLVDCVREDKNDVITDPRILPGHNNEMTILSGFSSFIYNEKIYIISTQSPREYVKNYKHISKDQPNNLLLMFELDHTKEKMSNNNNSNNTNWENITGKLHGDVPEIFLVQSHSMVVHNGCLFVFLFVTIEHLKIAKRLNKHHFSGGFFDDEEEDEDIEGKYSDEELKSLLSPRLYVINLETFECLDISFLQRNAGVWTRYGMLDGNNRKKKVYRPGTRVNPNSVILKSKMYFFFDDVDCEDGLIIEPMEKRIGIYNINEHCWEKSIQITSSSSVITPNCFGTMTNFCVLKDRYLVFFGVSHLIDRKSGYSGDGIYDVHIFDTTTNSFMENGPLKLLSENNRRMMYSVVFSANIILPDDDKLFVFHGFARRYVDGVSKDYRFEEEMKGYLCIDLSRFLKSQSQRKEEEEEEEGEEDEDEEEIEGKYFESLRRQKEEIVKIRDEQNRKREEELQKRMEGFLSWKIIVFHKPPQQQRRQQQQQQQQQQQGAGDDNCFIGLTSITQVPNEKHKVLISGGVLERGGVENNDIWECDIENNTLSKLTRKKTVIISETEETEEEEIKSPFSTAIRTISPYNDISDGRYIYSIRNPFGKSRGSSNDNSDVDQFFRFNLSEKVWEEVQTIEEQEQQDDESSTKLYYKMRNYTIGTGLCIDIMNKKMYFVLGVQKEVLEELERQKQQSGERTVTTTTTTTTEDDNIIPRMMFEMDLETGRIRDFTYLSEQNTEDKSFLPIQSSPIFPQCVCLNGKIYVFGGDKMSNEKKEEDDNYVGSMDLIFVFDIDTKRWETPVSTKGYLSTSDKDIRIPNFMSRVVMMIGIRDRYLLLVEPIVKGMPISAYDTVERKFVTWSNNSNNIEVFTDSGKLGHFIGKSFGAHYFQDLNSLLLYGPELKFVEGENEKIDPLEKIAERIRAGKGKTTVAGFGLLIDLKEMKLE